LTAFQRRKIVDRTIQKVKTEYFDPSFNGTAWPEIAEASREQIVATDDPDQFELAMHNMIRKLGTSHTGFFHTSVKRVPARLAIGVTFSRVEVGNDRFWAVRDIHRGGPGDKAGILPGDRLIVIAQRSVGANEQPMFPMGTEVQARVLRGSEELSLSFSIPNPRTRKQPYSEPQAVEWRLLPDDIGYLKVSIFPGLLGLDVARQIDQAVAGLGACSGLVLDLRGHLGGGLGVLRMMSHLASDKIPIGFTVTRHARERGYDKSHLRRLDRLPTHLPNAVGILSMALQFAGRDPSILLFSEGLGSKRWHGRLAVLVNEHTASAGEMIAAFVKENHLGQIVGIDTAGRLIPGSGFKVGHGYMLIMPKAEYVTWHEHRFEGHGVSPDVHVAWTPGSDDDQDKQLRTAIRVCRTQESRSHAAS
jgi:C-terminal processing protease CtpA/Prc